MWEWCNFSHQMCPLREMKTAQAFCDECHVDPPPNRTCALRGPPRWQASGSSLSCCIWTCVFGVVVRLFLSDFFSSRSCFHENDTQKSVKGHKRLLLLAPRGMLESLIMHTVWAKLLQIGMVLLKKVTQYSSLAPWATPRTHLLLRSSKPVSISIPRRKETRPAADAPCWAAFVVQLKRKRLRAGELVQRGREFSAWHPRWGAQNHP